jgi:asparagine synthase (glutamine-hydrolysing)
MCGIAGILHQTGLPEPELRSKLERLMHALRQRGPDGQGLWQNKDGTAGLAHTRLAVIDLTPAAAQPMASACLRYHITFNGEIYNHNELRRELEETGTRFKTRSDTEVLLALFERHGPAMLSRLRGMFAFAIWDTHERSCFLARDPLGIKPLYYTQQQGCFAFASEIKALQTVGLVSSELNSLALYGYLLRGSVREPDTLLSQVNCLQAGHFLVWKDAHVQSQPFWRLQFPSHAFDAAAAVKETRSALLDTAQAHFVSDVPVGLFLSSGTDSNVLLALAKILGKSNLNTFTLGVDQDSLDETPLARRTAAHFGSTHHEWKITRQDAMEAFQEYLDAMDQPTVDGFNTFLVARFARLQGLKVAWSGLGGDELFGGYPSFAAVPKMLGLSNALHRIPGLAPLVGSALERWGPDSKWRRTGSFLKYTPSVNQAFLSFRSLFSVREARQIAAHYLHTSPDHVPSLNDSPPHAEHLGNAISECETTIYMRNQLLRDSDVMSMAHGLELRTPLADATLFNRLTRIPAALRLQPGKRLLQQAVPELPHWITEKKKHNFAFPFESWLDSAWGSKFQALDGLLSKQKHPWFQRWTVFMLDHWLAKIA